VYRDHRRDFANHLYVYPVVSRRSKGVSIGINLNPDKICNFDCVYCQVDRAMPPLVRDVEPARLLNELDNTIDHVVSGALFDDPRFAETPPPLRRLNDLAFSGDGEPTTCPAFLDVVRDVAEQKRRRGLDAVKLVLITNATRFHIPCVREALAVLDRNQGEVWAKLEAGTEAYYHEVDRTTIPFRLVLNNITQAARERPLVIQSLFMRLRGEPPPKAEIVAFCDRLKEIIDAGGTLRLIQVYTIARRPAESFAQPLADSELDIIADAVRCRTGLAVETYPGSADV
jgi:wyosine [tRNA(Phe)-imidazoG37] synthetase (radical SAM superfamily)